MGTHKVGSWISAGVLLLAAVGCGEEAATEEAATRTEAAEEVRSDAEQTKVDQFCEEMKHLTDVHAELDVAKAGYDNGTLTFSGYERAVEAFGAAVESSVTIPQASWIPAEVENAVRAMYDIPENTSSISESEERAAAVEQIESFAATECDLRFDAIYWLGD